MLLLKKFILMRSIQMSLVMVERNSPLILRMNFNTSLSLIPQFILILVLGIMSCLLWLQELVLQELIMLPAISPLGSTLGCVLPVAAKTKRSRNRAHKKHGKKSKSKKSAHSAKPRKASVVRPSKSTSSSSSESSEDDEPAVNPQQV